MQPTDRALPVRRGSLLMEEMTRPPSSKLRRSRGLIILIHLSIEERGFLYIYIYTYIYAKSAMKPKNNVFFFFFFNMLFGFIISYHIFHTTFTQPNGTSYVIGDRLEHLLSSHLPPCMLCSYSNVAYWHTV